MNRETQLVFCKQCQKRAFNPKSGIICSITNEQASFIDDCENFEKDLKTENVELSSAGAKPDEALSKESTFKIVIGVIIAIVAVVRLIMMFVR